MTTIAKTARQVYRDYKADQFFGLDDAAIYLAKTVNISIEDAKSALEKLEQQSHNRAAGQRVRKLRMDTKIEDLERTVDNLAEILGDIDWARIIKNKASRVPAAERVSVLEEGEQKLRELIRKSRRQG